MRVVPVDDPHFQIRPIGDFGLWEQPAALLAMNQLDKGLDAVKKPGSRVGSHGDLLWLETQTVSLLGEPRLVLIRGFANHNRSGSDGKSNDSAGSSSGFALRQNQ